MQLTNPKIFEIMERTKKRIECSKVRKDLIRHVLMCNKQWCENDLKSMSNKALLANCPPAYREVFEFELKKESKNIEAC